MTVWGDAARGDAAPERGKQDRPSILLITTDTQQCSTLNCMGYPEAISPGLDRMAREGTMFTQGHTASPVCMPARASLLYGVHTPVHGSTENGIEPRTGLTPFTDLLADAGYTNIMVGKTHFGPTPASFHTQFTYRGEKNGNGNDFYAEFIRGKGFERASRMPNPVPEEFFFDAHCADVTMREIDRVVQEGKGPFFAFCSMLSPHGPIDPPGHWAELYRNRPLPRVPEQCVAEQSAHTRRLLGMDPDVVAARPAHGDAAQAEEQRRLYYGLAAYCDHQVGRILDYLDHTGLSQTTLVIFTSDHGSTDFDHGFHDKHTFHDSSWRVPLLMRMPGTLPQGETREFAVWTDLTATILGAAGLAGPAVQGFDLFAPLSQGKASPRQCAVGTLFQSAALATRRWKLEYAFPEGEGRLFDRQADSAETTNLWNDPGARRVREALLAALLTWRSELADIQGVHGRASGGGPVAKRVVDWAREMRGIDAEQRLNDRVAELEALVAG